MNRRSLYIDAPIDHPCILCGVVLPARYARIICDRCIDDRPCLQCEKKKPSRRRSSPFCSHICANDWSRTGALSPHVAIPHPSEETIQRFNSHIKYTDACWEWTGAIRGGYGAVVINKKCYRAHRVAWVIRFGDIPNGMCVCHHCDNPRCVRPDHLWLGTQQENQEDKIRKGRQSHALARKR